MKFFSRRHERALREGTLEVTLPVRLRGRIWKELEEVNTTVQMTDDTGYNWNSDVLSEVETTLKRRAGIDHFTVWHDGIGDVVQVDLKGLVLEASEHAQVFDVVEACWHELWDERAKRFQRDINTAFEEEACPWRLADGQFFKVDSEFLEKHILANAHALLAEDGFKGAMHEFLEARNDVTGDDHKDAILKACKSMESVLTVVLGGERGNASELLRKLGESGAFADLPEGARNALERHVLMALPTLRNKLGGHGQGGDVVTVPKRYAVLAVHLAAVFNAFLIEHHLQSTKPATNKATPGTPVASDDVIPF
jgi:hypothetical protein